MEEVDLTNWHKAQVKKGVLNGDSFATRYGTWFVARNERGFTEEFLKWKNNCHGRVAVKVTDIRAPFDPYVYFELKEDLALYTLTFDEIDLSLPQTMGYKGSQQIDSASFYCPYIPLQIHGTNK